MIRQAAGLAGSRTRSGRDNHAIIYCDMLYGGVIMDDFLEQVARRRRQGAYTALYFAVWILIVLFGLTALMNLTSIIGMNAEGGVAFRFEALIIAVISGGITFLLWRRADYCRMEYDYTFTNGTLDVSQVLNNKRRRYLTALDMKDVERCGPAEGQAFAKTLNEQGLKKHNWFLNRDGNLFYFFYQKNNEKHMIVIEPTDEMIEMIKLYLPRGVYQTN